MCILSNVYSQTVSRSILQITSLHRRQGVQDGAAAEMPAGSAEGADTGDGFLFW